ncbi:MAG: FadR/GntR family transcriptional regulator [Thermodesulfobacteriota bacterium]
MFDEVQQKKVALDIVRQVREAILDGKLRAGDRLPAEKDLVTQFAVSKHTLREALRALEAMGFLAIRKGSGGGATILEVDMRTTRDSIANFLHFQNVSVLDLSQVRKLIEPQLTRMAAEDLSPDALERLLHTHRLCHDTLARGENVAKYEIEFHRLLAEASGNPVCLLIQDFVNSLLGDIKSHLRPGLSFSKQVLAAHDRILDAIQARDSERAEQEMYRHVCEVEEALEAIRKQKRRAGKGRRTPFDLASEK